MPWLYDLLSLELYSAMRYFQRYKCFLSGNLQLFLRILAMLSGSLVGANEYISKQSLNCITFFILAMFRFIDCHSHHFTCQAFPSHM